MKSFPHKHVIWSSHVVHVTRMLFDESRGYLSPAWSVSPVCAGGGRLNPETSVTYRRPHTTTSQAVEMVSCHVWLSL